MTEAGHDDFKVRVEGIRFDAAHFATFGNSCEALHGHSYEVAATLEGNLSADAWVFDFIELKSILRKLSEELDHRFLLQGDTRVLKVERQEKAWQISTPRGISYALPSRDVVALPIDNTTAERLAQWFCVRVWQVIQKNDDGNVSSVTVEVYEGPGQRAYYRQARLPVD